MKVRKLVVVAVFVLGCFWVVPAHGALTSLQFSTGDPENDTSWTVSESGGVYTMSFANIVVNASNPGGDAVLDDVLNMPSMDLAGISDLGGIITATMVPVVGQDLTIVSDTGEGTVMVADVHTGGILTVGSNWIAYSSVQDDLDIVSHTAGYSTVIDNFDAADAAGYDVDLSFSGDGIPALYDMLDQGLTGSSASGVLSGQITAIPEPVSLLLLGLGAGALIRKHR